MKSEMQDELRTYLEEKNHNTAEQAATAADEWQLIHETNKQLSQNKQYPTRSENWDRNENNSVKCWGCKKYGHRIENCKTNPSPIMVVNRVSPHEEYKLTPKYLKPFRCTQRIQRVLMNYIYFTLIVGRYHY